MRERMRIWGVIGVFFLFLCLGVKAHNLQKVKKQTYLYAVKGSDHLYLDKYEPGG